MSNKMRILTAAVFFALAPAAYAQAGTDPGELNKGQNLVASKIASNFTTLAGSEDNALALVNALRTGGEVTLATSVPGADGSPPTITETTFDVPTKPMGWGNVKHALALAQDQLARAGITEPTAEQLQTALMGGDLVVTNADGTTATTTVKGILTMRADGMGWGNIAREGGTKLGPVTSKVDMSAKSLKGSTTTTTTSAGVTTAAGGSAATTKASKGITTAAGGGANTSNGKGPSKGITTASGATTSHGRPAHAGGGAGLVTGGGGSAASGITNAGGGGGNNAGGLGKGQGNGKGKGG